MKPADRNNIGVVTAIDDTAGQAVVEFVSEAGKTAERAFSWDQLTIIEPRHPQPRTLGPDATAALQAVTNQHQAGINRWTTVLAESNVAVDDPRIYTSAARLHIDRATAQVVAEPPRWLQSVLGERPTAPAAAQVWDDTVRDLATYRARHHVQDATSPLGPVPTNPDMLSQWKLAATSLSDNVAWLDQYDPSPIDAGRVRTLSELTDRRAELDTIIATAPTDQRHILTAITNGQLTLADAAELLADATAGQGDRQRWILEHWPHIVESAEVDASLVASHHQHEI